MSILLYYRLGKLFVSKVSKIGNFALCLQKRMIMNTRIDHIGVLIHNERMSRGLTQEELGQRVGVGKAQISKIESGRGLTIKTVTKVFGCAQSLCLGKFTSDNADRSPHYRLYRSEYRGVRFSAWYDSAGSQQLLESLQRAGFPCRAFRSGTLALAAGQCAGFDAGLFQ